MRAVVLLSLLCAVLGAVFLAMPRRGEGAPARRESSIADVRSAPEVELGDEAPGPSANDVGDTIDSAPATPPIGSTSTAPDVPPSAVEWTRDLGAAMRRAEVSGRLLLLYVAASADT